MHVLQTHRCCIHNLRYTAGNQLGLAVHWCWVFLHAFLKLGQEPHRVLHSVKATALAATVGLGLPVDSRSPIKLPRVQQSVDKPAFSTVGLLVFLAFHSQQQTCKVKDNEFNLLLKLLQYAKRAASINVNVLPEWLVLPVHTSILGFGDTTHYLIWSPIQPSRVEQMDTVLAQLPKLRWAWENMAKAYISGHYGRFINSTIDNPIIDDLLMFLLFIKLWHKDLWDVFGCAALQALLKCMAKLVETYVIEYYVEADTPCAPLPILRGRKGYARNTDPINRAIWMAKLKKVSFHNNFITHGLTDDLLPVPVQRLYDRVHCHVSMQQARAAFQGLNRIHLNMDASNHTEDTLVSTVYSPDIDKAAYASIVVLNKATTEDLDNEGLKILNAKAKLTRKAAFVAIKGMYQTLLSVGQDFIRYELPNTVIARPLYADEIRYFDDAASQWMVMNTLTNVVVPQVPSSLNWAMLPLMVVWIDQAQTGLACYQYLIETIGLMLLQYFDTVHRVGAST